MDANTCVMESCKQVSKQVQQWTELIERRLSKKKYFDIAAVAGLGFSTSIFSYLNYGAWTVLYIAAIVIPLILGMAGKVEFKWVILWEIVMFAPVGFVVIILFFKTLVAMALKR